MKILVGMEKIYDDWKNDNQDAYGKECFKFAEDWAELMEKEIDKEIDKENDIKKVLKEKAFETGMQALSTDYVQSLCLRLHQKF